MFSSPGMPKIYLTPSFSRHWTRSLAVVDSRCAVIAFLSFCFVMNTPTTKMVGQHHYVFSTLLYTVCRIPVALVFALDVACKREGRTKHFNLNRVRETVPGRKATALPHSRWAAA